MPTKREYLIELGLCKEGSRGRFSGVAQEALSKALSDGIVFDEPTLTPTVPKAVAKIKQQAAVVAKQEKKREQTRIWGLDALGRVKVPICFDTCAGCNKPIAYCTHDEPKLPNWIKSKVYWKRPTKEEENA